MALGELIEESRGKITGQRVLDAEISKMEASFTMEGNYRGTPCTDVGTYTSVLREGGRRPGNGNLERSRNRQVYRSWKSEFPWFTLL